MSDLPEGWSEVELDEICQLVRGITFPTTEKRYLPAEGLVACLRTANVQSVVDWQDLWFVPRSYVKSDDQYVAENDILISTANSYELVGKVSRVTSLRYKATLGAFISLLRANQGIDPGFLFYQMASDQAQQAIREMSSTTTNISNVSGAKLKTLKLKVAPPSEQTRIVAKLEELLSDLDAGVAELSAAQKKLVQYRQSLLKAAVEGALTVSWRATQAWQQANTETGAQLLARILSERRQRWEARQLARFAEQGKTPPKDWQSKYREPVAPDTTDLPELPEGWVWASLGQLLVTLTSGSRDWAPYYDRGSCVFVMAQNVRPWRPDFSFKQYVDPPQNDRDRVRSEILKDDLLVTIVGANTGQSCRIPEAFESYFVCQSVALLRLVKPTMSEYVNAVLNSQGHGQRQFREMNYGAGRPHLSFEQIEAVAVPLPPLSEQVEILQQVVDGLTSIEKIHAELIRLAALSASQRTNILKAAFAGQLVPQDPADEPASALLARIRAERASQGTKKLARGRRMKEQA